MAIMISNYKDPAPVFVLAKKVPSQLILRTPNGGRVHLSGGRGALFAFILAGLDSITSMAAQWMTWPRARMPSPAFVLFYASHQEYRSIITCNLTSSWSDKTTRIISTAEHLCSNSVRMFSNSASLQHLTTNLHFRKQ
jgi:hypothetical protein